MKCSRERQDLIINPWPLHCPATLHHTTLHYTAHRYNNTLYYTKLHYTTPDHTQPLHPELKLISALHNFSQDKTALTSVTGFCGYNKVLV